MTSMIPHHARSWTCHARTFAYGWLLGISAFGVAVAPAQSEVPASDKIVQSSNAKITDAQGRIRYIVDLVEDDTGKPQSVEPTETKIAWRKANSKKLIDNVTKQRGIELIASTSFVGTSFVAYLESKDVEQLTKDKRVAMLTEDRVLQPSAIWNSTRDPSGQVRPWGLQAVGATGASSNGIATVYVIDTGVEVHPDLPALGERISALPGINPTGVYPHATHVAGIIGASDNVFGVVGVLPNVNLVSISINSVNVGAFSDIQTESAIIQAFEIVYQRGLQSTRPAIINLSFNGLNGFFAATGTVGLKMKAVATNHPDYSYRGALIVQSAGNHADSACQFAYNGTDPYDGILVVGGLDDNGQVVTTLNSIGGYRPEGALSGGDIASNDGPCVEVWAPSQRVYSTWGGSSYQSLSGTSMAAPHVAGLAAYVLENDPNIHDAKGLEAAVRAHLVTIAGSNRAMPRFGYAAPTAAPTIEIREGTTHRISLTQSDTAYFPAPPSQGPLSIFPDQLALRYDSVGGQYCYKFIWRNGYYWSVTAAPPSGLIPVADLPGGQYVWEIKCSTLPSLQGAMTVASARGTLKRRMTVGWQATTTSTNGNWTNISVTNYLGKTHFNGALVQWGFNAPFNQISFSQNADRCRVEAIGYIGNPFLDPEHPIFPPSPLQTGSYTELYPTLWDSGSYFPTSYEFGDLFFADPHQSPYGIPYADGYKWRLTCFNGEDQDRVAVMYGRLL